MCREDCPAPGKGEVAVLGGDSWLLGPLSVNRWPDDTRPGSNTGCRFWQWEQL